MKSILLIVSSWLLITGCTKTEEKIKENLVVKAMTEGQWKVTKFTKDGTDVTGDFLPYTFQFRTNNTVEALKAGAIEKTGSWSADPMAKTIVSSFTNANTTLTLLNGTWQITNNNWTFVEATQTVNSQVLTLRLDK